jgi:hypothetical protein
LTIPTNLQVKVFTAAFRVVIERKFPNQTPGVPLSIDPIDQWGTPLASGLYYVVVQTPIGKTVGKLLILR